MSCPSRPTVISGHKGDSLTELEMTGSGGHYEQYVVKDSPRSFGLYHGPDEPG